MAEQKEVEETGEKGLGDFVAVSMRGPKRGIYQQLLARLLIKAVGTNDPLIKISSICEAAYTSKHKDELDMNHVDTCYAVCRSFLNTQPESEKKNLVRVAWSFPQTEENWGRYITPWNKTSLVYYPLETPLRHNNYPKKMRYIHDGSYWKHIDRLNQELDFRDRQSDQIAEEIGQMPRYQAFFQQTAALGRLSRKSRLQQLRNISSLLLKPF